MPAASAKMSSRPPAISRSSAIEAVRSRFSAAYRTAVPWKALNSSWSLVDMLQRIESTFDYAGPHVEPGTLVRRSKEVRLDCHAWCLRNLGFHEGRRVSCSVLQR